MGTKPLHVALDGQTCTDAGSAHPPLRRCRASRPSPACVCFAPRSQHPLRRQRRGHAKDRASALQRGGLQFRQDASREGPARLLGAGPMRHEVEVPSRAACGIVARSRRTTRRPRVGQGLFLRGPLPSYVLRLLHEGLCHGAEIPHSIPRMTRGARSSSPERSIHCPSEHSVRSRGWRQGVRLVRLWCRELLAALRVRSEATSELKRADRTKL